MTRAKFNEQDIRVLLPHSLLRWSNLTGLAISKPLELYLDCSPVNSGVRHLPFMDFSKPIDQLVQPHYLKFLHANFLNLEGEELSSFMASVNSALFEVEEDQVERLLRIAWREQLTGAWFAGLKNWAQFTERIGGLLIQSSTCYAGQGYCFALACFANAAGAGYLSFYLDEYLPQLDKEYDQLWALTALLWVDKVKGTSHGLKYLEPDGLWERFVAGKTRDAGWNLEQHNQRFEQIMAFRDKWFADVERRDCR